jgi:hypothetical protein
MLATVPNNRNSTATDTIAGRTIASPAQKFACQREKMFLVTIGV